MALSKQLLKSLLLVAFEETKADPGSNSLPLMSSQVADRLSKAYDSYAKSAMAGGMLIITVPGQQSSISSLLSSMPNMSGWGAGLVAYWGSIMFGGAGFIPTNPTIPVAALGASAEISLLMPPNQMAQSEDEFLEKLSTILDSYTKLVQVTATTTSVPPIIAVLPIM